MRNTIVFVAWTLLLVILLMAGLSFYVINSSDGTATYAQMGYDTGRHFIKVLIGSILVVALGKHFGFLPGFAAPKANPNSSSAQH